ncbi:GntR family transcriptional regulator [Actinomadura sp. LCR2-06]|uniref:GntR family transcriptional regulator n=1 Tax=Actinomadura violacea TaxID=2819934 RepID=A0ABS3RY53_9ACTN|nr:GntR family transcriptional regulator [Actinomadura violacea]
MDKITAQIKSGELPDGSWLPPVREIAEEYGVAFTTAAKAVRRLAAQGLVETSNRGTRVLFGLTSTYTPRERLDAVRRTGRIYPPSDRAQVYSSELVRAPEHVALVMGIQTGGAVIRRERVTFRGEVPVTYSVSWMPGDLAGLVPELLSTDRIRGGTIGIVLEKTGRQVERDTDRVCARRASEVEAERLGVAAGDPVLYGQNTWYEGNGMVLEFGEFVVAADRWM